MHAHGQAVRIEFVSCVSEIDRALWDECFPPPLEGRFWYRTLETCGLEDQFRFSYAVIKSGERTVGVAPCFLHDVSLALAVPPVLAAALNLLEKAWPRAGRQRTLFVGSPCSDEGAIGLVPGAALDGVLDELAAAVRRKARELGAGMVVFKDFPDSSLPALERLRATEGFFAARSYPGTVVDLPGSSTEDYLKALTQSRRHNIQKKLRRSKELLSLETRVVASPSDRELEEIFGLFQQTYEKGRTKFERLSPDFFAKIRGAPPARFILQRDAKTGELVAFMLVFLLGKRLVNKFIGLDYRRAGKTFLYFRLFEAALDCAYAAGATELQSGQTGYRAKLDLGHRLVPLTNVCRHENRLVNALYEKIASGTSWAELDPDLAVYLKAHPRAEARVTAP